MYHVMPYGLANVPSLYLVFMNNVFCEMLNRFVIVFIDDTLVFSRTLAEHVAHVLVHGLCATSISWCLDFLVTPGPAGVRFGLDVFQCHTHT